MFVIAVNQQKPKHNHVNHNIHLNLSIKILLSDVDNKAFPDERQSQGKRDGGETHCGHKLLKNETYAGPWMLLPKMRFLDKLVPPYFFIALPLI